MILLLARSCQLSSVRLQLHTYFHRAIVCSEIIEEMYSCSSVASQRTLTRLQRMKDRVPIPPTLLMISPASCPPGRHARWWSHSNNYLLLSLNLRNKCFFFFFFLFLSLLLLLCVLFQTADDFMFLLYLVVLVNRFVLCCVVVVSYYYSFSFSSSSLQYTVLKLDYYSSSV